MAPCGKTKQVFTMLALLFLLIGGSTVARPGRAETSSAIAGAGEAGIRSRQRAERGMDGLGRHAPSGPLSRMGKAG